MSITKSKGLSLFKINAMTKEVIKVLTHEGFAFVRECVYFTALNEKNAMRKFDNAIKKITK